MRGGMVWMGELEKAAAVVCAIAWLVVFPGDALADDEPSKPEVLKGHEGAIVDAVLSPNGGRLVSRGEDGTVRLWDLRTKKEVKCLKGHDGPVDQIVFLRDGSKLLTTGTDGTVRLWNATTGEQLDCFRGPEGEVGKVIVSPNDRQVIACGSDGAIRVWSLPGPKRPWFPAQATGAPDTPVPGDQITAWASATTDAQPEWLLLKYEKPVKAVAVHVYETYNPGALTKVTVFDAEGKEITAWEGKDPTDSSERMGVSKIPLDVDFPIAKVKLHLDSPAVRGWNEIDAVGLMDEKEKMHWAVEAEASSIYGDRASMIKSLRSRAHPPAQPLPPIPPVEIPEGAVMIGNVDETAEGKQSYGGSGFAIAFERPEDLKKVVVIELFASRYGLPQAPNEDIHVYLMDADFNVLHDLTYPYRTFERGEDRWYALAVDSLEVPERFHVGFFFNAHQMKGIYMGKDTDVEESHSYYGTVEKGFKPVKDKHDWMVRVHLMPEG